MFMECPLFQHKSFSKRAPLFLLLHWHIRLRPSSKCPVFYVQRNNISNCCTNKITPDSENRNTSWASEMQYVYHSIHNIVLITTFSHDNIYSFELMFSCGMLWFNMHAILTIQHSVWFSWCDCYNLIHQLQ